MVMLLKVALLPLHLLALQPRAYLLCLLCKHSHIGCMECSLLVRWCIRLGALQLTTIYLVHHDSIEHATTGDTERLTFQAYVLTT